jgi:integrase
LGGPDEAERKGSKRDEQEDERSDQAGGVMAVRRTGTIAPIPGSKPTRYRARIRLGDGSRPWLKVPAGYSGGRAREYAAAMQEQEDEKGLLLAKKLAKLGKAIPTIPSAAETCDEYAVRLFAHHKDLGHTSVRDSRSRWNVWVKPTIGPKPIATVSRDEVEDVRDRLDAAVLAYAKLGKGRGRLAPKTATNAWGVLTGMLAEACSSKLRSLRVRKDNPASGVQPPERGTAKRKKYVYPGEALALFACEAVPLERRELHAIAAYTFTRPGELRVLRWEDVDLVHGTIAITKAWDYANEKVKPTKTKETRDLPIEAELLPLLTRMRTAADGVGLVVPLLSRLNEDTLADVMRADLRTAGVDRPALFASNQTELSIRFRSWRDTGITWMAVRGDSSVAMRRRAGHANSMTTDLTSSKRRTAEPRSALRFHRFPQL